MCFQTFPHVPLACGALRVRVYQHHPLHVPLPTPLHGNFQVATCGLLYTAVTPASLYTFVWLVQ